MLPRTRAKSQKIRTSFLFPGDNPTRFRGVTKELSRRLGGASVISYCYAARAVRVSSTPTRTVDCPNLTFSNNQRNIAKAVTNDGSGSRLFRRRAFRVWRDTQFQTINSIIHTLQEQCTCQQIILYPEVMI